LDKENVVNITKQYNAEVVISCCIDQANAIACYVAEKLDLPKPYSHQTALKVTDKCLMKDIMRENLIPTRAHIRVKDNNLLNNHKFKYPVVVKPSDSTGSKGVRKANDLIELKKYYESILELSRSKEVIVEEFVDGFEIQIDCSLTQTVHK
jgi:biotin carboxylase